MLFRPLQLSDRVFRFLLSCKEVGFTVYRRHSFSCSSFKAYLHLWNSGGPNWIKEWQLFSDEESSSWTLVSRGRFPKTSYADIARSPVLSGANLVPLGGQVRAGRLKPRSSVFNRISFPVRRHVDQPVSRPYSHEQIDRRAYFQSHSNPSSGNLAKPFSWFSLRSPRARPWASHKSIWRPKRILNRHQEISKNKSALNLNEAFATVSDDSRSHRNNSFSGNNCQIFGFPRQIYKRDFLTFPSKFAGVVWEFPPQLWFKTACPLPAGGPSHPPFLITLVSLLRRFFREVALCLPPNLHCAQNPPPPLCRGQSHH
jgi:hypothetical protein